MLLYCGDDDADDDDEDIGGCGYPPDAVVRHTSSVQVSETPANHRPTNRLGQWRSQDLEVGAQGIWRTEVPSGVQGQSPWWVVRGGIASRKLIAVIKDIWLPNHAQFCIFSSAARNFLLNPIPGGAPAPPLAVPLGLESYQERPHDFD